MGGTVYEWVKLVLISIHLADLFAASEDKERFRLATSEPPRTEDSRSSSYAEEHAGASTPPEKSETSCKAKRRKLSGGVPSTSSKSLESDEGEGENTDNESIFNETWDVFSTTSSLRPKRVHFEPTEPERNNALQEQVCGPQSHPYGPYPTPQTCGDLIDGLVNSIGPDPRPRIPDPYEPAIDPAVLADSIAAYTKPVNTALSDASASLHEACAPASPAPPLSAKVPPVQSVALCLQKPKPTAASNVQAAVVQSSVPSVPASTQVASVSVNGQAQSGPQPARLNLTPDALPKLPSLSPPISRPTPSQGEPSPQQAPFLPQPIKPTADGEHVPPVKASTFYSSSTEAEDRSSSRPHLISPTIPTTMPDASSLQGVSTQAVPSSEQGILSPSQKANVSVPVDTKKPRGRKVAKPVAAIPTGDPTWCKETAKLMRKTSLRGPKPLALADLWEKFEHSTGYQGKSKVSTRISVGAPKAYQCTEAYR